MNDQNVLAPGIERKKKGGTEKMTFPSTLPTFPKHELVSVPYLENVSNFLVYANDLIHKFTLI